MAEVAVEPVVSVLAYRARVEHNDVRRRAFGHVHVPRRFQRAGEPLGVVHVHLTSVRPDVICTCGHASRVRRRPRSTPAVTSNVRAMTAPPAGGPVVASVPLLPPARPFVSRVASNASTRAGLASSGSCTPMAWYCVPLAAKTGSYVDAVPALM